MAGLQATLPNSFPSFFTFCEVHWDGPISNWSNGGYPPPYAGFILTSASRGYGYTYSYYYNNPGANCSSPPPILTIYPTDLSEVYEAPIVCPAGWTMGGPWASIGVFCYRQKVLPSCKVQTTCGDPIDVFAKVKTQSAIDYAGKGLLRVERMYRSDGFSYPAGGETPAPSMGFLWRNTYERQLVEILQSDGVTRVAVLDRANSKKFYFTEGANGYLGSPDSPGTLTRLRDAQDNPIGWSYESPDNEIETYDASGLLTRIDRHDGRYVVISHDASNRLSTVTDESGRALQFTYDDQSRLMSISLPDGNAITYEYNDVSALSVVHYPGGTTRHFYYNDPHSPFLLTSIFDENGAPYASFTYDDSGYPLTTVNAGGVEGVQVVTGLPAAYVDALGTQHTFTVETVANGTRVTGETKTCPGCSALTRSIHYDGDGNVDWSTDFNNNKTTYAYDATRFLETSRTEASGTNSQRTTNTTWNANFRVPDQRSVVDAGGVTEALTKWSYNSRGQVTARCDIDPADPVAMAYTCSDRTAPPASAKVRRTVTTYCEDANVCGGVGLVLSVDGPRTDVSDVTTYTYYQTTDLSDCVTQGGACHYMGDLQATTNALGQVTQYLSYDQNGRVKRMEDANGVLTDLTYSPRGWLLTRSVGGGVCYHGCGQMAVTRFQYDNVGNVTKITQPDGAYLSYGYDDAHRLTDITDNVGDHIHYTLDAAGNRTDEKTFDPSGNLKRELSRQYDQLDRLWKALNFSGVAVQTYQNPVDAPPSGITYTNGYDGNGNAIYSADANSVGTEQQYDPLNRLVKTLQDHAGTGSTKDTATQYAYDARDNLRSVTDPDNLVTNYTYDGLNNLTQLQSPDTGTTTYGTTTQPGYDAAGNRLMQTDANGITVAYSYDALNRLTGIAYPTTSLNVTYAYDVPATGCYNIGRLTQITDSSGSTAYCYDRRGNVLNKVQVTSGTTFTTGYTYTLADRLASITYPSGAIVSYDRDTVGRVTSVTYKANATATAQTILSNVSYYPFGPANVFTFGNGHTLTKSYDQDYAINTVASSDPNGLTIGAKVDALGNLIKASSTIPWTTPTQQYQYDPLYRLTNVQDGSSNSLESFTYGLTGDRLSKTLQGQTTQSYTYTTGTHRLATVAGVGRSYDLNGNTTAQKTGSLPTLTYDNRNRLSGAQLTYNSGTVCQIVDGDPICHYGTATSSSETYTLNGRGERVGKTYSYVGGPTITRITLFTYGENGQLLAEYAANGAVGAEYIYLDGTPIAYVTNGTLYYIETDQLGTPRTVVQPGTSTATDAIVWAWDYFGSSFGEDAPSGTLTFNLRFPGQYFDQETGLNYNYFRDYEPGTGRYVESDPAGLDAGPSTYAYLDNAPLSGVDPLGLVRWRGSYDIKSAAVIFGGANGYFDLTSDCVDHKKFNAVVHYVGPVVGWGPKVLLGGETGGEATFNDHRDNIDPSNLEGLAGFFSIGATIGSISAEPGKFRLGNAFSENMSSHGFDIGAQLGLGKSFIIGGKGWINCDCKDNQQ